jgi:hypothetical protein
MPMRLSKTLRVFLLYARRDGEAVRRLYSRLVRDGANVWLDREKLLPGQDWACEIHEAIHSSDVVIACLSKQFNKQGGYRHEELKIALEKANQMDVRGIFIIPARLEPCEMPEPLPRWQRVDLFDADGYKRLVNALRQCVAPA